MKILFYFGHPAQYLFSRNVIKRLLASEDHEVVVLIKTKDVLEDLLRNDNIEYTNFLQKERGASKFSILLIFIKRLLKLLPIFLKKNQI